MNTLFDAKIEKIKTWVLEVKLNFDQKVNLNSDFAYASILVYNIL